MEIIAAEPAAAAAAIHDIESAFRRAELDWYAFGTGELAGVNQRLARGESAPVSAGLAPLLERALRLHRQSGGLFDPGVCALVRLWHFDSAEALAGASAPPAASTVRKIQSERGTMADVRLQGPRNSAVVSASRPLCIDLGGMAKGTALEQARAILARHGIGNALVDIGGSSQLAIGRKGPRDWAIGLKDPRGRRVFARLALGPGEAAATSGNYERSFTADGHRYHHVLDPGTGNPARGSAGVTVLAANAEWADGASTALMVAGPARLLDVSAALNIDYALLVTDNGELFATPAMAERLRRDNHGELPVL